MMLCMCGGVLITKSHESAPNGMDHIIGLIKRGRTVSSIGKVRLVVSFVFNRRFVFGGRVTERQLNLALVDKTGREYLIMVVNLTTCLRICDLFYL